MRGGTRGASNPRRGKGKRLTEWGCDGVLWGSSVYEVLENIRQVRGTHGVKQKKKYFITSSRGKGSRRGTVLD